MARGVARRHAEGEPQILHGAKVGDGDEQVGHAEEVGVAPWRERVLRVVGRDGHVNAGLGAATHQREALAHLPRVAPTHQVEVRRRQGEDGDAGVANMAAMGASSAGSRAPSAVMWPGETRPCQPCFTVSAAMWSLRVE